MKLYPWMIIIFIIGYALANTSVMYFEPHTALIGFVLFVIGLPFYYLLQIIFNSNNKVNTTN